MHQDLIQLGAKKLNKGSSLKFPHIIEVLNI
jgi:hypothetical protein